MVQVGVRKKLGEVLLDGAGACGKHECLVAVVATAPVAFFEGTCHCQLGHFLAIAKDSELGLASQHFFAANQACLTAQIADAVVSFYFLSIEPVVQVCWH